MDMDSLNEFGAWLEQEGLQAIATRVSTGEECSIIIEDGYVAGQEGIQLQDPPGEIDPGEGWNAPEPAPSWKAGEF
ncbi:hypothetical protein D3C73_1508820 [compost metagenome]